MFSFLSSRKKYFLGRGSGEVREGWSKWGDEGVEKVEVVVLVCLSIYSPSPTSVRTASKYPHLPQRS